MSSSANSGNGVPTALGDIFRLTKGGRIAACVLWSHWSGWELRLYVAGETTATQVCRSQDETLSTAETWRKNLQVKGWSG